MKLSIQVASTSQTVNIFIRDSSSASGTGLTGLVFNTSGLTAYYALSRAASVAITLATLAAVTSAFSSGGFKEIDATNMPGWYRFDIPDAALASGRFVSIHFQGAANMVPLPIEIELTGWNNQDAVRGGMTAMPNANAAASGGLPILGANSGTMSITASSANTAALTLTGNGTGAGLDCQSGSGATGNGINAVANSTNGHGIAGQGKGSGTGLRGTGGVTGSGILGAGGATSGSGITAAAQAGASNGITITGTNAGHGISITPGSSGNGLNILGGATSGAGINISTTSGNGITIAPTAGHGISIQANGTDKHGIVTTGGTAGTSDGFKCVAGTGGVDIRGNITGDLTGNVSGSTGSVAAGVTLAADALDATAIAASGANEIADALLDRADAVETGLTPRQAWRLEVAAAAGVLGGAATTTVTINNAVANTKPRITATVDADGNRTAVVTDVT